MLVTHMSVIVALIVAAVVVAVSAEKTAERKSLTVAERQTMLNKHNELRKAVKPSASNMKYMTWDAQLEKMAQQLADNCKFEHGEPFKHPTLPSTGQNIFVHSDSIEIGSVVQTWYSEEENYKYQSNSCTSGKICGHYTQVVWANSGKLGCGIRQCSSIKNFGDRAGYFVVCNYGPAGNFIGMIPYETGNSCSACPTGHSCQDGLCKKSDSCSDKCENGAKINDDCICG